MGASIDGSSIPRDDSDERAFYGTRETTLTAKVPEDLEREINDLRDYLPPTAG